MKILAVVTARMGSKRLPGKNIKLLGGKPMINWTIEVARGIDEICDVLVTTDSTEIAEIARNAGAYIPWLRPNDLASESATSVDVVLHALNWYEENNQVVDGVLLLQPTSPFRSHSMIREGLKLYKAMNESVVAVSPWRRQNSTVFVENGKFLSAIESRDAESMGSLPGRGLFCPNGGLYIVAPAKLRKHKSFFEGKISGVFVKSEIEELDIDTEHDWLLAEKIIEEHFSLPRKSNLKELR